jgi:hypothetical protein
MSRVFMDGAETGTNVHFDYDNRPIIVTHGGLDVYTGNYAFNGNGIKTFASTYDYLYFALRYITISAIDAWPLRIYNSGSMIGGLYQYGSSYLQARKGASTPLGNGTTVFEYGDPWRLIEVYYHPDPTSGSFVVKVAGETEINYSGSTTSSATTIDGFGFAMSDHRVDDIVIDDADWIGDTRILGLPVIGNGTTNDCLASLNDTDSDNYKCVDEIPGSTNDYVYSNSNNIVELYTVTDFSTSITSIKCVQVSSIGLKYGAPTPTNVQAGCRTGSSNYFGDSTPMKTVNSIAAIKLMDINPNTSSAWSDSDIDGLEIGFQTVA